MFGLTIDLRVEVCAIGLVLASVRTVANCIAQIAHGNASSVATTELVSITFWSTCDKKKKGKNEPFGPEC